jgi:hypothetical protein
VVETCHQPITAKNDPSDQESDVHLGSVLSVLFGRSPAHNVQPPKLCGGSGRIAAIAIVQFGGREIAKWQTI